jgi:hypothetical protein
VKKWLGIGAVLFLITLAVVIGLRMDSEAMAVVMGVIFGVAASIPTSLIIVAITWRREHKENATSGRQSYHHRGLPPSVVIVNPNGSGQGYQRQTPYLPPSVLGPEDRGQPDQQWSGAPRQFRVVGEPDEAYLDEGRYL